MKTRWQPFIFIFVMALSGNIVAQDDTAMAHYLGNEGVMVEGHNSKIMFDPLFRSDYNRFMLVPDSIKAKVMKGDAPYDNIDVILVSHTHTDHFDKVELTEYLNRHRQVKLVAPNSAVEKLKSMPNYTDISGQIHEVSLDFGDPPKTLDIGKVKVDAVRIPHIGWPQRKEIQNLVYRVTLDNGVTVMHLGDADADPEHYVLYRSFWAETKTNRVFLPAFSVGEHSAQQMAAMLNAKHIVYVHVPVKIPAILEQLDVDYFSVPGEIKIFETLN